MKEFIDQERRRLQTAFLWFNQRGGRMTVRERGSGFFVDTIVDSFTVTRIAPKFDTAGNHIHTDFWLLWKALGYNEGFQHAHTVKIIEAKVDETLRGEFEGKPVEAWLIVDLIDDRDRVHHVELIEPGTEPDLAADWRNWSRYKQKNSEMFGRIDAQLLSEHLAIAEEWP